MESGLDGPGDITNSLGSQRGGILRYILDNIPDAKKCILSSLYPFDVAKVLMVTGHALTLREKSVYINPLYDVMRHPHIMKHFDRAGVKMILLGEGLHTIKSRVLDPKKFKSSYSTAELGIVVLLFTHYPSELRPMYRFVYDEGKNPDATEMDEFMVRIYMKHMRSSAGGVGLYHVYHSIHSRTSLTVSPASHDTTAVVFMPDEEDLRQNRLVLSPNIVPDLYGIKDGKTSLAWAQVTKCPSHLKGYTIGSINHAAATSDYTQAGSRTSSRGLAEICRENIMICSDDEEEAYCGVSYKIPLSACFE